MPVNLGFYEDAALTTAYSVDKVPYESGYYPVFHGETFDGTNGEAKNKVLYLKEIAAAADYYYTAVQVSPLEVGDHQRDPDEDSNNEWHVYFAKPVETTETDEAVGTGNDVLTEFDFDNKWVKPDSETVKLAGNTQVRNVDYWICYKDGHIAFATPPGSGVAVTASYTHGDDGAGNVNVPAANVIEANGDWTWTDVWKVPHGYDANRGTGHEADAIPIIMRGKVDAGTSDPSGNAITLHEQDVKVKGQEHNAKL